MLVQTLFNITALAAIVSSAELALDDIDPMRHGYPIKKPIHKNGFWLIYLAPRDGLEPPTGWLTATCSTS